MQNVIDIEYEEKSLSVFLHRQTLEPLINNIYFKFINLSAWACISAYSLYFIFDIICISISELNKYRFANRALFELYNHNTFFALLKYALVIIYSIFYSHFVYVIMKINIPPEIIVSFSNAQFRNNIRIFINEMYVKIIHPIIYIQFFGLFVDCITIIFWKIHYIPWSSSRILTDLIYLLFQLVVANIILIKYKYRTSIDINRTFMTLPFIAMIIIIILLSLYYVIKLLLMKYIYASVYGMDLKLSSKIIQHTLVVMSIILNYYLFTLFTKARKNNTVVNIDNDDI